MAWGRGTASGIDDLVKRLVDQDEKLKSLTILRFRRLNDSDVEALAKALHNNSILQELNCSSHSLTADASAALGTMLQHNRGLKRISIGNSSWGDQALSALAAGLKHNTLLEAWDLEHKGLTAQAASSISGVVQTHPSLQQLVLSRNALQDAGVGQLCAGPWAALRHLELADCALTAGGVEALAAAAGLAQLHHLDLSHNDLGPAAAQALQQLMVNAEQLQSLVLMNTAVGGAGVAGLAKGLPSSSALKTLDLSCTKLDDTGLTALTDALSGSKQQLQAAAAAAEAAAVVGQPPLQQLLLGGNPDLSDAALSKLAAALTASIDSSTSVTANIAAQGEQRDKQQQKEQEQQQWHLDLAHTGVGPDALQALSKVPGLQSLSLFGCKLGSSEGEGAPIEALQACLDSGGFASLQGLNISGCNLSNDQLKSLMDQLAAGSSSSSSGGSGKGLAALLKTLELGANPGVQHDGFEALVQKLREARPGLDVHWRVADSDAPPEQP